MISPCSGRPAASWTSILTASDRPSIFPCARRGQSFRKKCGRLLCRIPYGQMISYRELATRVGAPRAFQAVGQANGHNPLPILIPCHRVIAANGTLGGYSGGLERKRFLLHLEGHDLPAPPAPRRRVLRGGVR